MQYVFDNHIRFFQHIPTSYADFSNVFKPLSWIFWRVSTSKSDFPDVFHDLTRIFLSKSYFLDVVVQPLQSFLTILTSFFTPPSEPKLIFDRWLLGKQLWEFLKIFLQKSAIKATATKFHYKTVVLRGLQLIFFSAAVQVQQLASVPVSRFHGMSRLFLFYSQVHQGNTLHRVLPGQLSNMLPLHKPTAVVI